MPERDPRLGKIHRIVTGHDNSGIAKVLIDDSANNAKGTRPGMSSTLIWATDRNPADIAIGENIEDMGARKLGTAPPANGSRFIVMDFLPGTPGRMHRTETIDYIICLEGEIDMDMDEQTVTLKAGDIMVQRGTNHSWCNRGTEKARLAIVLLDAAPIGIGQPVV